MNILALKNETFDSFHHIFKEDLVKAIERYNKCIIE